MHADFYKGSKRHLEALKSCVSKDVQIEHQYGFGEMKMLVKRHLCGNNTFGIKAVRFAERLPMTEVVIIFLF